MASSATLANVVAPSLNVTLEVGTPPPGDVAVTVAVKVTVWPKTVLDADELTCVFVAALLTTCGAAVLLPVLFDQPLEPAKLAVMTCEPTNKAPVVNDACPAESTATADASTVAPSRNVTAPVGVPELDATVAVNVTGCPNTEGFGEEPTAVVVAPPDCTVCVRGPLLAAERRSEA